MNCNGAFAMREQIKFINWEQRIAVRKRAPHALHHQEQNNM